jgi:hypothetical protein
MYAEPAPRRDAAFRLVSDMRILLQQNQTDRETAVLSLAQGADNRI